MRLAIVLFAVGLSSCQIQHTPLPEVAPPALALGLVTKILIAADVDGRARLCVEVTAAMRFERPTIDSEVCGYSVGELRQQFAHLSSAN